MTQLELTLLRGELDAFTGNRLDVKDYVEFIRTYDPKARTDWTYVRSAGYDLLALATLAQRTNLLLAKRAVAAWQHRN